MTVSVPLTITEPAGIPRVSQANHHGPADPQGFVRDASRLPLRGPHGTVRLLQVSAPSDWADGSINGRAWAERSGWDDIAICTRSLP